MNLPSPPQPHSFVAISLPPELKTAISERSQILRNRLPFRKWTHPEDLHLTLMFLGAIPEEKEDPVRAALASIAESRSPLTLAATGLGTFGLLKAPRVLYTEVDGELDSLLCLVSETIGRISELGFEADRRPYSPHITLARRYEGFIDPDEIIRSEKEGPWSAPLFWKADSITLYRSHPKESPMYEPLRIFPLRGREKRENHFV